MRYIPQILTIPVFAVALAAPSTSYRSSYSTFAQEDRNLSVFVDGYPASMEGDAPSFGPGRDRADEDRGRASRSRSSRSRSSTRRGTAFSAAGFEELKKGYSRLEFDRTLMRNLPIDVGQTIATRPRIASNFYPPTGDGMKITRVELSSFSWFRDVVYFPRPPAGLGGVMTLAVAVEGGDPMEVRFVVGPRELSRQ